MFVVLAILSSLAGVFLLGLAWLSGHRSVIPKAVKPLWFWVPGLACLLITPVIALGPSMVQWNACSSGCTMSNAEVSAAYEKCVTGARATLTKDAASDESLTQAQIDYKVGELMPDAEAQCRITVTNVCTTECFNAWWDPEMAQLAEQP